MAKLSDFTSLLSFTARPPLAIKPSPPPALIQPLMPTDFHLSPFLEKVVLNPYQTSDLNILSEAELAIDNVISFVESVLPKELVDGLKKLPALAQYLLGQGTNLESVISNLVNQLPLSVNLTDMLRRVPIMSVLGNLPGFLSTVQSMGLSVNSLPGHFTIDSFDYMGRLGQDINLIRYNQDYNARLQQSLITEDSESSLVHPVATAGIGLAMINSMAKSPMSLSGTTGVSQTQALLPVLTQVRSTSFAILANGVQQLGIPDATILINLTTDHSVASLVAAVTALGGVVDISQVETVAMLVTVYDQPTITNLSEALTVSTPNVTTVVNLLLTALPADISQVVATETALGLLASQALVAVLATYTPVDIQSAIDAILATDIDTYEASDDGSHATLITAIRSHGIDAVSDMADSLVALGQTSLLELLSAVDALGPATVTQLVSYATALTPAVLKTVVDQLSPLTASLRSLALTHIAVIGAVAVTALVAQLADRVAEDLSAFISATVGVSVPLLIAALPDLQVLTESTILAISTTLSNQEPYTALATLGVEGEVLAVSLRLAAEAVAEVGNYRMLLNLLEQAPTPFTPGYKRHLITRLLHGYKLSDDDLAVGVKLASENLVNALFAIYPEWDKTMLNGAQVMALRPYMGASADALYLLQQNPLTAVAATLQRDKQFHL